jgi:hypothetical protein
LDPNIHLAIERKGTWAEDEDMKLKDVVQTHGAQNWGAIAALIPGRTEKQCQNRWHYALDPSIHRVKKLAGKWSDDEDSKLKDAVQTHGGKNWGAVAVLVPGRSETQCRHRWCGILDPNIDRANGRAGIWTEDEDIKLKDAVQMHGGKNWGAIASLVRFRTRTQCMKRWHNVLDPTRL